MDARDCTAQDSREALVKLLYRAVLGRDVEPDALASCVAALAGGESFADMFRAVATSEEARNRIEGGILPPTRAGAGTFLVELNEEERISLTHDAIEFAYTRFLRRTPTAEDVRFWAAKIAAGTPFEKILSEIARSEEARLKAGQCDVSAGPSVDPHGDDRVPLIHDAIGFAYAHFLHRTPTAEDVTIWADEILAGMPVEGFLSVIARSEEARIKAGQREIGADSVDLDQGERIRLIHDAIGFAYAHFLYRSPTPEDVATWTSVIATGMPVERFLSDLARSEEARVKAGQREIGAGLSDGEFLMAASDALFGRGLTPIETVAWQRRLESGDLTRAEMVRVVVEDRIRAASHAEPQAPHVSDVCSILGTSRMLSRAEWNKRADEFRPERRVASEVRPLAERRFRHTGDYAVSMIASLYRGRTFIEKFLENIVSQTLFDRSELIIVDADSPEREWDVIEEYCKVYPNIVYRRINYRLGIYDAWNVGVETARGHYLTNTNLDDLRRRDSIALQAAFLDEEVDVDVVYQDFYYSFDPSLTFEEVEAFGFKSELPILTPNNLLLFNSPHNAPMWRKNLHDQVGLFDTRYRSAGDYEFWVRCAVAGKSFGKINTPHVVYYQNPKGISTRPDTRGLEESHDILRRYGHKLTRKALLQSRRDLYAGLGIENRRQKDGGAESYFNVIQAALIELGERSMPKRVASSLEQRGTVERAGHQR